MSYQVIARKWRPKAFTELVGQDHVSQTLSNALSSKRLPHALLFTGPRGTGKTSSARILAKALRCPQTKNFVPCNECSECDLINHGSSLDVLEIDGASNNGVDAVRELRNSVGYQPSTGTYKVYIIDEVHMLSGSAFNALLKTLEEPPPHIVFILATTEVHKIPNTILSRCQRFDFRRIPTRQISERLELICKEEGVSAEPEALWAIARQGDGSMRDSQSLLDQIITFSSGSITLQKVIEGLGLTDRSLLTEVLQTLVARDEVKTLDVIEKIFTSGLDVRIFTHDLLEEVRHLLMVKVAEQKVSRIVDLPDSEIEFLRQLAAKLSEEDIHLLFDMTLKGANDIQRAQEPRLVLEMLLLRMANAPRLVNIHSLLKANLPKNPTGQTRAPIHKPTPQSPPQPKSEERARTGSLDEKWSQLVARIQQVNGLIAAKLEHSYLKSMSDQQIVLSVPGRMKFLHQQVLEPDFQKKLGNYIKTFWGRNYEISIETDSADEKKTENLTPSALAEHKARERENQTRQEVESHPLVKSTQQHFKAQIQEIKELT